MSSIVHYEVYVQKGSQWDMLGRYSHSQKQEALEYAKSIEQSENRGVKIVKESYDLEEKTYSDSLVYMSKRKKTQVAKNSASDFFFAENDKKEDEKSKDVAQNIMMLFFVVAFSTLVSVMLTAFSLRLLSSFGYLSEDSSSVVVLIIFAFFFFALATPISMNWVNWDVLVSHRQKDTSGNDTDNESDNENPEEDIAKTSFFAKIIDKIITFFVADNDDLKENYKKSFEEDTKQEENSEAETTEQSEIDEEIKSETVPEKVESETEVVETADKTEQAVDEIKMKPATQAIYVDLKRLLSIILRVMREKSMVLNAHARFGVELFLAGACEQLSKKKGLDEEQNKEMLHSLLILLSNNVEMAHIFYSKLEEYMLEKKYLSVIEAGSNSVDLYLQNPASPEMVSLILSTMEYWINPSKKDVLSSGLCTVMFTDIVSSTEITNKMGDLVNQQLVSNHNQIVRKALQDNGGIEVKHTGDGIMASFKWTSNSIAAAIQIQKALEKYNKQSPTVPLVLRIGLNAGEPIVENDDLFGLTVQMAARVCNEAGANQIYVSSVVKNLSGGKGYRFKSLGDFSLKGIAEPQKLYEVLWNEKQISEIEERGDAVVAEKQAEEQKVESKPKEKALADSIQEF